MKKRTLSLLLTLSMLLGLFPATAMAAESTQNSTPIQDAYMVFTSYQYNSVAQTEIPTEQSEPSPSLTTSLNSQPDLVFYYATSNGNSAQYHAIKDIISFSGDAANGLAIQEVQGKTSDQGNTVYTITPTGILNNAPLLIHTENTTYSLSVTTELPTFGFYTSSSRQASDYLPYNMFQYTAENRSFYFLADNAHSISSVTLPDSANAFLTAKVDENGKYVQFTVSNSVTEDIEIQDIAFTFSPGSPNSSRSEHIRLINNADTLRFKPVYDFYGDNGPELSQDMPMTDVGVNLDDEAHLVFYYGTSSQSVPAEASYNIVSVEPADYTVVSVEPADKTISADGKTATIYTVTPLKTGTTVLNVTLQDKQYNQPTVTYQLSVNITLPDAGFYSTNTISANSFLKEGFFSYGSDEDSRTFYFLSDVWSITNVHLPSNAAEILTVSPANISADNPADTVTFTVKPGVTVDADLHDIEISLKHPDSSTDRRNYTLHLRNAVPTIRFRYVNDFYGNGAPSVVGSPDPAMNSALSNENQIVFYYGTSSQNTPAEKSYNIVSVTSENENIVSVKKEESKNVSADEVPATIYTVTALKLGNTVLNVTLQDNSQSTMTYQLPVSVALPHLGFYTEPTARESSFLWYNTFRYDQNNRQFYFLSAENGLTIVGIENESAFANYLTVESISDKMVTFKVKDGLTASTEFFDVKFNLNYGSSSNHTETWQIRLENNTPVAWFKYFEVGPQGPGEGMEFGNSMTFRPGTSYDATFYYGTSNNLTPLTNITGVTPADPSLLQVEQAGIHNDGTAKNIYRIKCLKTTSASGPVQTSLTITADGETYVLPVTVNPLKAGQLYYTHLIWDDEAQGDAMPYPHWLMDDTISMAPYVDMNTFAFFFSPDGMTYEPVEITIDRATGYDYVPILKDSGGNAVTGWYAISPFDFTTSSVSCTVNGQTDSIKLETNMPWLAFYSEKTMLEETFRMYVLMDENPNAQTDGFKYRTTLYVNSPADFSWTDYYTFSAEQKQYNAFGNELDSIPVPAEQYKVQSAGIDANGYMTVELYSNIGDLLVWLEGYNSAEDMAAGNRSYGTYVNLLTPGDGSSLIANLDNNGFAAAKFLPRHLFQQLADRGEGITIGSGSYPGSVHYDKDVVKNIVAELNSNGKKPVCLIMDHEPGTAPQDQAIDRYAQKNKDIVSIVNLDVLSGSDAFGTVAQGGLGGKATISYPCELNVPNGSKVDVYYLDSSNNVQEKIEGTYADGVLTFQTTHFSSFAITVDGTASSGNSSGGGNSSSGSSATPNTSSPTVSTDTKTDAATGSTTVTETKKDGTVVETTTNADGSSSTTASKTEVKETASGTTTTTATNTTTKNADGSTVTEEKVEETLAAKDGSTTTTTTTTTKDSATGETVTEKSVEKTVTDETGKEVTTSTTETKSSNGSSSTTTVAADGTVTTDVTVSSTAVNTAEKAEAAVTLPMPAVEATTSTDTAPTVTVNVPASADSVKVEIPVADVNPGTVVVIVAADGTETIVPTTALTENGVAVTLEGDATVKVIDNSKDFGDVAENSTFAGNIDFVSARGLFNGTTSTTFEPNAQTTRGQVMTVLARAAGADTSGAAIQKGMDWAVEAGISDGTNPGGSVTRQQLATMLWRFAGEPHTDYQLNGLDADSVSSYAEQALAWCIENGIMTGYGDGSLKPTANASRAHVAAMVARYINTIY